MASIGVYLWILIVNSVRRGQRIASAKRLPLPGCPVINGGTEWALWIPRPYLLLSYQYNAPL